MKSCVQTVLFHLPITQTPLVTDMFDWFLNHVQSLLPCYRDALSPGAERAAVPNRYGGVAPIPNLVSSFSDT